MASDVHAARRARLLEALGDAVAILPAAPERQRNGDNDFPYRQDSDLWYLTGFPEPESVAVLSARREAPYTLFVRPRDPAMETWTGYRQGVDGALARYGAAEAHPISELPDRLPELLLGHDRVVYPLGRHPTLDERLRDTLAALRDRQRDGRRIPGSIVDPSALVHELRLRKGPEELETMRRAGRLSCEGHAAAMRCVKPGMRESDVQAILEYVFRRGGAQALAYPSICAGGAHGCILHYVANDAVLDRGDLILVDAGAELDGYAGDVTRTFPVGGRFTPVQREVYEVVLEAQQRAIEAVGPGAAFTDPHQAALEVLVAGMVRLGLLEGEVDDLIERSAYKPYYMHRTSHWLGLDVHDVGSYYEPGGEPRVLGPGMVLTIEPGLYVPPDDERAPAHLRGIGIRIEDDVLVTDGGHEVLSLGAPTDPDEIEALMTEPGSLTV